MVFPWLFISTLVVWGIGGASGPPELSLIERNSGTESSTARPYRSLIYNYAQCGYKTDTVSLQKNIEKTYGASNSDVGSKDKDFSQYAGLDEWRSMVVNARRIES
ncbi:hypothetical protein EVAR_9757_1 [Eumeta japonica]|uniref:Uncharacterized protein n=1 Tax=Eumeta variegata TaxID=151549 RepID=A0A4C1U5D8_EUMVA|nr:hypothetical protein EVAR_9757_1 [Eumeta japonica]